MPILVFPNISALFLIEVDSLSFVTRTVLSQESRFNNKWYPVVLFSKSLPLVKYNYKIHNKEMLAIIQILEE